MDDVGERHTTAPKIQDGKDSRLTFRDLLARDLHALTCRQEDNTRDTNPYGHPFSMLSEVSRCAARFLAFLLTTYHLGKEGPVEEFLLSRTSMASTTLFPSGASSEFECQDGTDGRIKEDLFDSLQC